MLKYILCMFSRFCHLVIVIDLILFFLDFFQALSGFVALRDMVRHTESQFHLRQFD